MTVAHPKFAYEKGLHQLGNGAYAWLQPDGGWGWSNSGLIVDDDQALVIDTLFDVPLTRDMLDAYADASKAANTINMVVNTHHNGDHCNGNCCCPDAKIIAHRATAEHMALEPPALVQGFLDMAPELGELGKYLTSCFGPFDFKSVDQKIPDTLFDEDTTIHVGGKEVHLLHVGPAHTPGDTLVHVPADRTVYTGDILFIGGHPILWEGPVQNWIDACKGMGAACSHFDYSGPLTEVVLLGNLAIRTEGHLLWDGPNMRVTNNEVANQWVQRAYRTGWKL